MKSRRGIGDFAARWYFPFAVALWFLAPGLRRLVDWQFGHGSTSVIIALPLIALLPLIVPVVRNASSPNFLLPFKMLSYFWLFGFLYALVVAFASGGKLGAVYQFINFVFPLVCGLWLLTRPASRDASFEQLTSTFLWLGGILGVYGIYQFVSPPPWDVAWVNNTNINSIGAAVPFGLRVFSTLNSPGTASFFFTFVVLLNLHKLSLRRPLILLPIACSIAALALTNVRSAWLALAVGVLVYLVLSPKRGAVTGALAVLSLVTVVVGLNASTLLGSQDVTTQLVTRLNSLGDVDSDYSLNDRKRESAAAMHEGVTEPLGQGLGTVGTATKLSDGSGSSDQLTLDNGYLSRFVEMGVAGLIGYLLTLAFGIIFTVRAFSHAASQKDVAWQQIAVIALSVQVSLLGLDLSGDAHSAMSGLVFWVLLALTLRPEGDGPMLAAAPSVPNRPPSSERPLWA
jgi:hypothetical protein